MFLDELRYTSLLGFFIHQNEGNLSFRIGKKAYLSYKSYETTALSFVYLSYETISGSIGPFCNVLLHVKGKPVFKI